MTHIDLIVNGADACAKVHGVLTAGAVGVPVKLCLDESWAGLAPRLIASCFGVTKGMTILGGTSTIPWECLISGAELKIGIDGWDAEGNIRIPTEWASCGTVRPSVSEADPGESADPTPEEIAQLTALAETTVNTANSVRQDADNGLFNGRDGKSPYIGDNLHWFEWDDNSQTYVDTGVNADATSDVRAIKETLKKYNSANIINASGVTRKHNGVNFTWDGNVCTVHGTATATASSNFWGGTAEIPPEIIPGQTYQVNVDSTDPNISVRVYTYGERTAFVDIYDSGEVVVPVEATGFLMRVNVASGMTVDGQISARILSAMSNHQLEEALAAKYTKPGTGIPETDLAQPVKDKLNASPDLGQYLSLSHAKATVIPNYTDFDTLKTVGNMRIGSSANAQTMINCPTTLACNVYIGSNGGSNNISQLVVPATAKPHAYFRIFVSRWSDWCDLVTDKPILDYITAATMESFFTDLNNAPVNSTYTIGSGVNFLHAPPGNNMVDRAGEGPGYLAGTVTTHPGATVDGQQNKVQLYHSYSSVVDQSILCFRSTRVVSGALVWSRWSKLSDAICLHATNEVIRQERIDSGEAPFDDMDNAPINSIYQIDLDCTTMRHHPLAGHSTVLITFGFSNASRHGIVQQAFGLDGGAQMYYRYGYIQSSAEYRFTAWYHVLTEVSTTGND